MENFDFPAHDKDFAVMFDAACFLLRSFDLYSLLNSGVEGSEQCERYLKVMREIIMLTANARVRAAFNDFDIPGDLMSGTQTVNSKS